MSGFFLEYGLFALKTLTFLFLILILLIIIVGIITSKQKEKGGLEIEKINDKLDDLKENMEIELYSKEELKIINKRKKTEEKKLKKEKKQKLQKITEKENTPLETQPRMFVIRFDGDLHASEVDSIREVITSILSVANHLTDEVLVILESSGGLVHNYGLAASQLQRIRDKNIRLTCAVDLVAASGGYMMACVANHIIAAPFAVIGSIGVLAQLPNFNRFLDHMNIDIEHHTAGEYKSTLTMLGKNSEKSREKFCQELEDTHQLFKSFVSKNRPQIEIDKIATGEHWYGSQAINLQLIDEIKTSDDYLLEKSSTTDIFEIRFKFHETIKEKLCSLIHMAISRSFETIWDKLLNHKTIWTKIK